MEKEQIVTKLTEVIHDVLPELDEVDMHANMVNEYGVNSVSLIRLLVAAESLIFHLPIMSLHSAITIRSAILQQ